MVAVQKKQMPTKKAKVTVLDCNDNGYR